MCRVFGYEKISTPIFEQKDLYVRAVGDDTDIVDKELFELENKSENVYVLRPELTAGIVRSLIENGVRGRQLPIMYYSIGDIFRYDKPQKGRFRQSSQFDVEIFGASDASADVFLINTINEFFKKLSIKENLVFNINTLGSKETKIKYGKKLFDYLNKNRQYLCDDCAKRIEKNPLRVLDCKQKQCQKIASGAPAIYDLLAEKEKLSFKKIVESLEALQIPFNIDQTLVRGLDYYTGLIFEVNLAEDKERKLSLGGGGRYDSLVEELGGPPIAACGFGLGIERITEFLTFDITSKEKNGLKIIVTATSDMQKNNIIKIQNKLARDNNKIVFSYLKKASLSDSLGFGAKSNYDYAVIVGDEEAKEGKFIVKDLKNNKQEVLTEEEVIKKF